MIKNPAYEDFRNFAWMIWKHLGLPDPTPVQYDISEYLQHGPKRAIIQAYRGAGKSYLTSAYALWHLYWDEQKKIMVVSASKERSDAFSTFCLLLIRSVPELKHLAPRHDQRRSLVAFDVNGATPDHSPSIKSVGITGQITGSRADIIIADDVEVPKNSLTQDQRDKLEVLVTEFDAIRKPLDDSRILFLGTPQCEDSLYTKLPQKGYETRIWPSRKPVQAKLEAYNGNLAPFIENLQGPQGMPTDPLRFDEEDLAQRELSYGKSGFALQFMLDTSLTDAERYPLKCSDFIVMDVDRDLAPVKVVYGSGPDQQLDEIPCAGLRGDRWFGPMYVSKDMTAFDNAIMFIDPSGRGTDETGYCVLKSLNGAIYMRRAGGLAGGYEEETLTTLAHIARSEKVNEVWIESNFGDGMYTQLFEPVLNKIHPCSVEEVHHTKQKELRIIDTLEPALNSHRIVIDKAIIKADYATDNPRKSLVYQLTRLTKDKNCLGNDDRIDAFAGGVAQCIDVMAVSNATAEQDHRDKLMEQELKRFMDNAIGSNHSFKNPSWISTV